jgi:sporulation protein YlmC with PRC-barrel domain
MGKAVVGVGARVIGHVCDMDFSIPAWKITHISINLQDDAIEPLGFSKSRLRGNIKVDLPVEMIGAVRDVVALNKSLEELKTVVRRR